MRDLATINYGRDPSAILDDAGEYPVYGTSGSERQGTGYHYEGESIILGRKGSIDRVHFAEGRFWTIDTAYFLSDFDDTVPKWLYYLLCSIDLRTLNEATGVPSLSRDLLYQISTPRPPPDEQAKIAEVLSTVDRAIEQTEALIAKQQRIKTGLMQDLLTRGSSALTRVRDLLEADDRHLAATLAGQRAGESLQMRDERVARLLDDPEKLRELRQQRAERKAERQRQSKGRHWSMRI